VQRFGGFVAKYMGDGVLVYFGYPQAHEDDTERAVRAALELVAAVGGLKTHAPLQTRIGIATGLVVRRSSCVRRLLRLKFDSDESLPLKLVESLLRR
jgi:class 3 adenylate cyclase